MDRESVEGWSVLLSFRVIWFFYVMALGFDLEGATQLKNQLFNTQKWLGTSGEFLNIDNYNAHTE